MRLAALCAAFGGMVAALTGCGSLHSGLAEIFIETNPPGATCTVLRAEQPVAEVSPTPGIVNLDPAATTGLSVACRRRGYADIAVAIPPAQMVGGWGSGYPEPQQVRIPLVPAGPAPLTR